MILGRVGDVWTVDGIEGVDGVACAVVVAVTLGLVDGAVVGDDVVGAMVAV